MYGKRPVAAITVDAVPYDGHCEGTGAAGWERAVPPWEGSRTYGLVPGRYRVQRVAAGCEGVNRLGTTT